MKPYRPYAATLGGRPGPAQLEEGDFGQTHQELLGQRKFLGMAFALNPRDFLMGRFMAGPKGIVFVDTASDLLSRTIHNDAPLKAVSKADLARFHACLRASFNGKRILLLTAGLAERVSGLSPETVQKLSSGKKTSFEVMEL